MTFLGNNSIFFLKATSNCTSRSWYHSLWILLCLTEDTLPCIIIKICAASECVGSMNVIIPLMNILQYNDKVRFCSCCYLSLRLVVLQRWLKGNIKYYIGKFYWFCFARSTSDIMTTVCMINLWHITSLVLE